jgi:hypothetical protein
MAFKKSNTPRFVVTGSPRAMKIQAQVNLGNRPRLTLDYKNVLGLQHNKESSYRHVA